MTTWTAALTGDCTTLSIPVPELTHVKIAWEYFTHLSSNPDLPKENTRVYGESHGDPSSACIITGFRIIYPMLKVVLM